MMKRLYQKTLFLVLIVALSACSVAGPGNVGGGGMKAVKSDQARVTAPQVAEADQQALSAGNRAFALDLYQAVREEQKDGNLFSSPYSISLALAMTYAGARGETQKQMADVLHFTLPDGSLHPAFNALDQELASRKEQEGQGSDGKGFRLNIVNDLWGQQDYTFLPDFLDVLAKNYGAGLRLMDFKANPEGARQEINNYIAEQTEQRIKDLLPQGVVDPMTRLILTNAIYFNAAWMYPFEKELTKDQPFNLLDGSQKNVPMMTLPSEGLGYLKGDGFQAVELPYENGQLSMLLLVPDEGQFAAFEDGLDAAKLDSIEQAVQYQQVMLKMPRFTFESQFSLGKQLPAMGMQDAFSAQADFSGMDGTRDLFISDVIHKAFVKVDEAGTEAAAATAVVVATSAMPAEPITVVIDRPFIFLIEDQATQTILFLGRVTAP